MHIPLWTTLLRAAHHNAASLARRTNSADICLPFQLQAAVPYCALNCLQSFIANNYRNHDCSSTADLNLLCTTKTSSGLTIGEGSLQCVISNCLGANLETRSGYTICEGVPGALPNMAGTITATISAFNTLTSSAEPSSRASTSRVATASGAITGSLISTTPTSSTGPVVPITSSTLQTSSSSSTLTTSVIERSSTTSSIATTTSESSLISSSTTNETLSSTSAASTIEGSTPITTSHTSSSPTGSATAAAATEAPAKQQLSTSAIAGIATACVVIIALLLGYFAYWFYVKRREQNKRRSQRLSTFSPSHTNNNSSEPPAGPALTGTTQVGSLSSANKRFYSEENHQQKRRSFWRRSYIPPSSDIGVAVAASTSVPPEHLNDTAARSTKRSSWPSPIPPLSQEHETRFVGTEQPGGRPWSIATSFDEDVEAQNQDLPALASPGTRSSSRSFSSAPEKPPPLMLKTKTRANISPSARIPLTPTYDNGNYEPTIRQVVERAARPSAVVGHSKEQQPMNFLWKAPSLTRMSQEEPGQLTFQSQQRFSGIRSPVRPIPAARKQSTATDKSISVYTEIEEDSTPEQEEDKELRTASKHSDTSIPPLRDLQWPQIPRSAATTKQAEKVPSPRAALTIRIVSPSADPAPLQPAFTPHDRVPRKDLRSTRTSASSSDFRSERSVSLVFPTPPARHPARNLNQAQLARQISDAYKSASRPTATTTPTSTFQPIMRLPQSRTQAIPRLGTGRPLLQKSQAQGYMPRPKLTRSTSHAKVTPKTSRSGDLYLTVGEMEH